MSLTYVFLFLAGVVLGLLVWQLEEKNRRVKNMSKQVVKALFIVSLVVMIVGITMVYAAIYKIGMYMFIPTLAVFLTRKTFIYYQARN